jgi:hypothetical protein
MDSDDKDTTVHKALHPQESILGNIRSDITSTLSSYFAPVIAVINEVSKAVAKVGDEDQKRKD